MAAKVAASRAAEEAAAVWERVANAFETTNPGRTDTLGRTRICSWRALARRRAGEPGQLRAHAESLAADGWQAGEDAREQGGPLAGAWAAALQAEQRACQAYQAWEEEAERRQEAEANVLEAAEAKAEQQTVLQRMEQLEAEMRRCREEAEVEKATRAEQTASLANDVARLERFIEGVVGPEVSRLRWFLPETRFLVRAARAKRPAATAAPPSKPLAANPCEGLLAALPARHTGAPRDGESDAWQDTLASVEATRMNLAEAVQQVRADAAALGAAAPTAGEEKLASAAAARDQTRAEHLVNIEEAMGSILACNNCTSAAQLRAKVDEAKDAAGRAEAALEAARGAQAAEPELGARAAPPNAVLEALVLDEARAAYDAYVRRCDGTAAATATEEAVQAFEKLGPWERFLSCCVQPGEWSMSFTWQRRRMVKEQAADPDRVPPSLDQVAAALERVAEASRAESEWWDSMDPVGTFPLRQLLAAGVAEVDRRALVLRRLSDAAETHQVLAEELDREQKLAALVPRREAMERELRECRDEHADAELQLDEAKMKEKNVKRKRGVVEPVFEEATAAARRRMRQADARFQGAMSRLLGLSRDLPEVARWAASAGMTLPPELLRLWRGCRDLDYFAECERLQGGHAHEVHRVREASGDGTWHVVKRYELRGGDLKACLAEAALLVRLRHPHVAEVTGLFSDLDKYVYMQMTYYSEGDLAQWVASKKPNQPSVRRACWQVLVALAHLHDFRVVHSDVKPENVFVDQYGNARLGDFDVSVDKATRCSTERLKQTRTKVQFTAGYEAPELLTTGATEETDMYSYGRTVAEACGPEAQGFVTWLTRQDPRDRLTAKQALKHHFFEATKYTVELTAFCALCCEDDRQVDQGLFCGSAHFLCGECLCRYIREELDMVASSAARLQRHQEREGRISCPFCPGAADAWSRYEDSALGRRLPDTLFHAYLDAKDRVTENRIWREQQERLQAEVARLQASFERDLAAQREASEAATSRAAVEASNQAATAEYLRRQCPTAMQCPRCGLGPVIHENCHDLALHHGEARARGTRVSNACLGCGFFAADISAWRAWDGHLRAVRG